MDDLTWIATWNLENKNWGRTWKAMHQQKVSEFLDEAVGSFNKDFSAHTLSGVRFTRKTIKLEWVKPSQKAAWVSGSEFSKLVLKEWFTDAGIQSITDLLNLEYQKIESDLTKLNLLLDKSNYFMYSDLLNNQNQFNITTKYKDRDELIGRNELSVNLALEIGFGNNLCKVFKGNLKEYRKLTNSKQLARNERLAINVEYLRQEAWSNATLVMASEDMGMGDNPNPKLVELTSDDKFKISLTYGWNVLIHDNAGGKGHDAKGRWELAASYEDPTKASMEQSRFIAALTYTTKTTDKNTFPISLRYSNRSKYVGEVDQQISAHFGIKYKGSSSK